MTRLLSTILNIVHLLKSQGRHTPDPISHQDNAGNFKAELQLIQTTLKQISAEAEADRALQNEELRLERQRLRVEQWTLAIVIVGTLGAFANLWFLKSSADITKQQLLASSRPWVKVNLSVGGDLKFGPDGTYVNVRFMTKSYGTTPAVGVHIEPEVFLASPHHGDILGQQTQICTRGRSPHPPGQLISGSTLFPGDEKTTDIAIQVPQAEIERVWQDMKDTHKDINTASLTFFHPIIIGCVNYRFTFDDTLHRTPFSAELDMRDVASGRTVSIDTRLGTIPAALLVLNQEMSMIVGGSYAD